MKKTEFDPQTNGYRFVNSAASAWGNVGVCGGMSWSALDHFYHPERMLPGYDNASFPNGVLVTGARNTPSDPSFADYVWKRQMDSINANWADFLLALSVAPNTSAAFARAKTLMDAGQPVPIALPTLGSNAFEGHHVVGVGYQEVNGERHVAIYDPNEVDKTMILVIVRDDLVTEHVCTPGPTGWAVGAEKKRWKGLWIANGFAPETPPAGIEDLALHGFQSPATVTVGVAFTVNITIHNYGEFDTGLYSLAVSADGKVVSKDLLISGGRVNQSFSGSIDVTLPVGWSNLEVQYRRDAGDAYRAWAPRATRRVLASATLPTGSYLELGSAPPSPINAPVLGDLLSGPSIFQPFLPRQYKVKEWKLHVVASVQDDLGGGSFIPPVASHAWSLRHGTLRTTSTKVQPRSVEIEATYVPVPGRSSTVLDVEIVGADGAKLTKALSVDCSDEYTVWPQERIPDIRLAYGYPGGMIPDPRPSPFSPRIRRGPR